MKVHHDTVYFMMDLQERMLAFYVEKGRGTVLKVVCRPMKLL